MSLESLGKELSTAAKLAEACRLAYEEAMRAAVKFKPFNSSHEGYAVLAEEVDELWDAIKSNQLEHARKEAIQVAAVALRYIADVSTTKEYLPGA